MEVISVKKLAAFATSGWLVNTEKAAEIIGCTTSRVRQMARAHKLREFSLGESGRSVLFDLGEIRRIALEPRRTGRPRSANT